MKAGRGPGPEATLGLWPPAGKGICLLEKGPFQAAPRGQHPPRTRHHRQLSRGICLEKATLSGLLPHFCYAGSVHWVLKQVTRVLNSLKAGWGGVEGFRSYHVSPGHTNSCRVRPFPFARTPSHVGSDSGSTAPVALTLPGRQLQPPVRTVNGTPMSAPAECSTARGWGEGAAAGAVSMAELGEQRLPFLWKGPPPEADAQSMAVRVPSPCIELTRSAQ